MIWADGIPPRCKIGGEFIHLPAREAVDDARLIFVAFEDLDGLLDRVALLDDFNVEILAVETGDEFVGRGELERGTDVLPYPRRGCGRERQADRIREAISHFDELAIFGAEVVPPLRDAVGFVDREQGNFQSREKREDARGEQRFGRDVEQLHFAALHVVHIFLVFLGRERTVEE